jgi:hypothetical protein
MVGGVVGLVFADRNATAAFLGYGPEHVFRRTPLGRSRGMSDQTSHRQS